MSVWVPRCRPSQREFCGSRPENVWTSESQSETFLPFLFSLFVIAMASNLEAMASNLLAMASTLLESERFLLLFCC